MMTKEDIMEMTDSEKIKYYINLYKSAPNAVPAEKKATRSKSSKSLRFNVTLSSGLDTVIERTEASGTKQLIIMPSMNKYVFKDGPVIQDVKDVDFATFKKFFVGLGDEGIPVNNVVFSTIRPSMVNKLYELLAKNWYYNGDAGPYRDLLNQGLMSMNIFLDGQVSLFFYGDAHTTPMDMKLLKMVVTKTGIMDNTSKYNRTFLMTVNEFYVARGYDAARVFAESYTKSSMMGIDEGGSYYRYRYNDDTTRLNPIIFDNSFKTSRLIQYLCFDLYSQGFTRIPSVMYADYVRNSYDYEEKVRDKYPEYLITEHDKIALKAKLHKDEIDRKRFDKAYNDLRKMFNVEDNVVYKRDDCELIIPNGPNDLIDEGQSLGHCVGTYVRRVSEGECAIIFARHISDPSTSYLTVELCPARNADGSFTYSIAQIQGDCKRVTLTAPEIDFFNDFMKRYKLRTTNRNFS